MTAQRRPPLHAMEAPPSPNEQPYHRQKDRTALSAESGDHPPRASTLDKRRPSDEAIRPPNTPQRSQSPLPPQSVPPQSVPPQSVAKFNMEDARHYLSRKFRFLRTSERHVLIAVCVAHLKAPGNNHKHGVKVSITPFVDDPDIFIEKMWKYICVEPADENAPALNSAQNGRDHQPAVTRAHSDAAMSEGRSRPHRRRPNRPDRSRSRSSSSVGRYRYHESRDRRRHHERRSRRRRKRADRDRRLDRHYDSDSDDDDRGRRSRKRRRRHRYSDEESDRDRYYAERDSGRYDTPPDRYGDGRPPEERRRSPPPPLRRPDQRYGERRDRSPHGRSPDRRNVDDRDRSPPRDDRMEKSRDLRDALSRRPRDEGGATRRASDERAQNITNAPSPRGMRRVVDDDEVRRVSEVAGRDEFEHKPNASAGPGSSVDSKGHEATTKLQHLRSKALASLKKNPSLK